MKNSLTYSITNLESITETARQFMSDLTEYRIFAFRGSMGSGKTTFIKALCEAAGVTETVSSPTFALVNEYRDSLNKGIYHFDFYRIESPAEALDMGYEDYVYSNAICFIEWPEKIETLLPEEAVNVYIEVLPNDSRKINVVF